MIPKLGKTQPATRVERGSRRVPDLPAPNSGSLSVPGETKNTMGEGGSEVPCFDTHPFLAQPLTPVPTHALQGATEPF